MMKKQNSTAERTLLELWIGMLLYFMVFETIGLIFFTNRLAFTLGLLTGCLTAGLLAWNLYHSIGAALEMDAADGAKVSTRNSIIRRLLIAAVLLVGMKLPILSFPAVLIGIVSLKISAFLQPYTNAYITERIFEKKEE